MKEYIEFFESWPKVTRQQVMQATMECPLFDQVEVAIDLGSPFNVGEDRPVVNKDPNHVDIEFMITIWTDMNRHQMVHWWMDAETQLSQYLSAHYKCDCTFCKAADNDSIHADVAS